MKVHKIYISTDMSGFSGMVIISGSDIMTASSYLVHSIAMSNQSPPGFQLLLVHIARIVIAKVEMCGFFCSEDKERAPQCQALSLRYMC